MFIYSFLLYKNINNIKIAKITKYNNFDKNLDKNLDKK